MSSIISYLTSSIDEVKKVSWPTKKEVTNLTINVIGVSLAVGLFVSIFDYIFKELLTYILI